VSKQNLGCVSAAAAEAQAKEDRRDLCEQALAGVTDPAALMAAVRECVATGADLRDNDCNCETCAGIAKHKAALRRLGEVVG